MVLISPLWFILACGLLAAVDSRRVRHMGRGGVHRRKPNILFIMTDDQDIQLGSMEFMPQTLRLLRKRGAEFVNGFVTTPICCPSRTSILTGKYVHNHHVQSNNQNCTGHAWRTKYELESLGPLLNNTGYRTGYFGKYLNNYKGDYVPSGWHEWMGLIRNSRFYNYSVNHNGERKTHGNDYAKDYFTDLIANDTVSFLQHSRRRYGDRPLLMVMSFPAPHGPEDPAPQHSHMFEGEDSHRTAGWNYAPNPDKEWLLQRTGKMEPVHVVFTDLLHRRRLQTLQAVDDAVHKVISELRDHRELQNTYIVYTSDHGYHLGQFGLIKGKNMPYEFDIKVPFFIRGPAVPKGIRIHEPVSNLDLVPTMLDMAGVSDEKIAEFGMDGVSILPLLRRKRSELRSSGSLSKFDYAWRQTVLIERGRLRKLDKIRKRMLRQRDQYSKNVRLQRECTKSQYAEPCRPRQRWVCRKTAFDKWRVWKCEALLLKQRREKFNCSCESAEGGDSPFVPRRRSVRSAAVTSVNATKSPTVESLEDSLGGIFDEWEDEFLNEAYEEEIVANNEWHQGLFTSDEDIFDATNLYGVARARTKRSNEPNDNTGIVGRSDCEHSGNNSTCRQKKMGKWRHRKANVNRKILTLLQRLQAARVIRKQLKRGRPNDDFGRRVSSRQSQCDCPQNALQDAVNEQKHPLNKDLFISDAQALAYKQQRKQINRKNRVTGSRGRGRGKKWRSRQKRLHCRIPMMNCFTHDPDHWRTEPRWPSLLGEFCFCQNSNNNTYWCLRTVNATHDFLYCEFVTGFISYYNMRTDPFQLKNAVYQLSLPVLEQLNDQLDKLKTCRGADCEKYSSRDWNR